ncbi:transcriptional repressor LexA [Umboniibacter marinipuniceus]|uniref:LexA repressor n=1 Tax=Umboniibacter marinipuniceus TaxID=569599 RepID=A0A3M0A968_9GAMM|nr:transcriptional repressor LexA [Umboniibacter marinipuniceus]RMA81146.1 SOS-response transcriptional repressor LexA [Umboniibacter marinipuniceus]
MVKLTKRQQDVLDVLAKHIADTGLPPTRAEIAAELGFKSANAAEEHLKALARKGAIEKIAGTSRGLRILVNPEAAELSVPAANDNQLPIVGKVAAGSPVLAIEHVESHCPVSPDFFHPRANYMLNVQGDSMIDIGIHDGDLLAVHQTKNIRNGDIVVARIDDEVTVKRYEKLSAAKILLHAENEEYSPIEVDLSCQDFDIEGISVGVIRRH